MDLSGVNLMMIEYEENVNVVAKINTEFSPLIFPSKNLFNIVRTKTAVFPIPALARGH